MNMFIFISNGLHLQSKNYWGSIAVANILPIDLLFERKDSVINIYEIKCTEKPFVIDKSYYNTLLNKVNVYNFETKTMKQIFVTFISASGVKKNIINPIRKKIKSLSPLQAHQQPPPHLQQSEVGFLS